MQVAPAEAHTLGTKLGLACFTLATRAALFAVAERIAVSVAELIGPSAYARASSWLAEFKLICTKARRPNSTIPNTTNRSTGAIRANSTATAPLLER
mgnify:CR=1 FL=1